jgi:hypothetical protein
MVAGAASCCERPEVPAESRVPALLRSMLHSYLTSNSPRSAPFRGRRTASHMIEAYWQELVFSIKRFQRRKSRLQWNSPTKWENDGKWGSRDERCRTKFTNAMQAVSSQRKKSRSFLICIIRKCAILWFSQPLCPKTQSKKSRISFTLWAPTYGCCEFPFNSKQFSCQWVKFYNSLKFKVSR